MSDKTFTISTKSENFRTKLNFVDKNNVFVGYDFGQS